MWQTQVCGHQTGWRKSGPDGTRSSRDDYPYLQELMMVGKATGNASLIAMQTGVRFLS